MADFNQFGSAKPGNLGGPGNPQHCAQCEAMLSDALDGTLSAADQATFDLHLVGCPSCATMLADAQRGAAWMEMLKSPRPEPPTALLERIIAQTSGQAAAAAPNQPSSSAATTASGLPTPSPAVPLWFPPHPQPAFSTNVLPFRTRLTHAFRSVGQTMLQPRLAMTAAMAFFSIALTLNLTGVRLSDLRASDFKPSSIMRSAYEAKAKVVRYSDNLRVVYELESRVRDLQRSSDDDGSAGTTGPPDPPALRPIRTTPPARNPTAASNPTIRIRNQAPRSRTRSRPSPTPAPAAARPPAAASSWSSLFRPRPLPPSPHKLLLSLIPASSSKKGDWYELRQPSRS